MASITPHKDGWRAQVKVRGVRDSETFRTKREALAWAGARETEIREQAEKPVGERVTLREVMVRYQAEVTTEKRGQRAERIRIDAILAMDTLPLDKPIAKIQTDDLLAWRHARLRKVKPGSFLREIGMLTAIFEHARRVWKIIKANPVSDVPRPPNPEHRERTISRAEIRAMLRQLGYVPRRCPRSVSEAIGAAFVVALRTGMRQSELCGLTWDRVFDSYCLLPITKTKPRAVPLTWKARRTIETLRGFDPVRVFGVQSQTLDTLFRRARGNAGLSGFTFHDSRHTAATWLARKIDVLDLCKMFGWSGTKRALTYYNPTATDIARRLEGPERR